MKLPIAFTIIIISHSLVAQDTLRYETVLEMGAAHSPRLADRELIDRQGVLALENVQRNWYPELMLNGKATYQSDVVSIEIDQPGFSLDFPEMPHEQFGLNLDVRQNIYDGGFSKQKKKYEELSTTVSLKQVETDIYALKTRLSELYFSALLLQENRKNLEIALDNLRAREEVLASSVKNGVAEENDLKMIRVEILELRQSLSELEAGKEGLLGMIRIYTDMEPGTPVVLASPNIGVETGSELQRKELELLDLQSELIEAGKSLKSVQRMPKVFAFGQAGIGMPGYNLLNDQVSPYYMVGAGVQWKIWDWNVTSREKQIMESRQQVVAHSRETFSIQTNARIENELKKLAHYRDAVALDREMLELRREITRNASSKLDHGVINATEYLQVLNDENLARVKLTTDRIRLARTRAEYQMIKGNL